MRYGAPGRYGRFRWLPAKPWDQIPRWPVSPYYGEPYTEDEQLEIARGKARTMVRVFHRDHPGQGWAVGIFRGRKLVERFLVDEAPP